MKLALSLIVLTAVLSNGSETDQIISKFDQVEKDDYRLFYKSLFAERDDREIAALTMITNDSIATQAAWEGVKRSIPKESRVGMLELDSEKLARFIGLLEGRNRVVAPDWWRSIVLGSRANPQHLIYPGKPKTRQYHKTNNGGIQCPLDATIVEDERKVVTYRSGTDSVVIPAEILTRSTDARLSCNISCVFTKTRCFVATHTWLGTSHDVACLDRKTGKTIWKRKACGCFLTGSRGGGYSGRGESWVSLVPTPDHRIFVFGYSSTGIYMHEFEADTGKTLVRFSTDY